MKSIGSKKSFPNDSDKLVVINQPTFLPWVGYFDMINHADTFVILDTVQFSRQSWQQRNRIKTTQGPLWLTVPVKRNLGQLIKDTEIHRNPRWITKHLKSLGLNYKEAPFFDDIFPLIKDVYHRKQTHLSKLNSDLIQIICNYLEIDTLIIHAQDLPISKTDPVSYVLDICKYLGATRYLNGPAGKALYDKGVFESNGIELSFHNYKHPVYNQLHGEFIPYLSIIDLLFNYGKEATRITFNEG